MRYELRTTIGVVEPAKLDPQNAINTSDKLLRWLYEYLPTKATLRSDLGPPSWFGSRYTESAVRFVLVTYYRDVFAATADRLRIERAVETLPDPVGLALKPLEFDVLRVFGDAELVDWADPTKPKITYP